MAFPTILVDSATGQDFYSGAGPAAQKEGSAASFAAAVVSLDGAPDLSGVATDGSHTIYLQTSTGVRHFKIIAKDDGLDQVTVTPNPAGTSTGLAWAIGGKRVSIGGSNSVLLFDNAGAAGDAMPGWRVRMASGHTETLAATFNLRRAGDTTDGPIILEGDPAAATPPILTFSNNGIGIFSLASNQHFYGFEGRNSNGTKTASEFIRTGGGAANGIVLRRLKCNHATNNFWMFAKDAGEITTVERVTVGNTVSNAILGATGGTINIQILDSYFHDIGANAVDFDASGTWGSGQITNCIFDTITGIALLLKPSNASTQRSRLAKNAFYNTTSDAVKLTSTNLGFEGLIYENNIHKDIGGIGLNIPSLSAAALRAMGFIQRNNDYHNCTGGKYVPTDLDSEDESVLDPQFTDAPNGNFTIGTNLKALGAPLRDIGCGW